MPALRTLVSTLAILPVAALPLAAQQATPPPVPDTVRQLFMEFQGLQQRLDSIQQEALAANPALDERRQAVEQFVNETMLESHPGIESSMERLPELRDELVEAREAQDTTRLRRIVEEGQAIQARLGEARAATLRQDAVEERIQSFREDLLVAMKEVDPSTDQVMTRMEELAAELQAFQPGG